MGFLNITLHPDSSLSSEETDAPVEWFSAFRDATRPCVAPGTQSALPRVGSGEGAERTGPLIPNLLGGWDRKPPALLSLLPCSQEGSIDSQTAVNTCSCDLTQSESGDGQAAPFPGPEACGSHGPAVPEASAQVLAFDILTLEPHRLYYPVY